MPLSKPVGTGVELLAAKLDLNKKDKKIKTLQDIIDDLEDRLRSSENNRRELSKDLKCAQRERDKATKRASDSEQNLKQLEEQLERERNQVTQGKAHVKQLQRKVDELQKARKNEEGEKVKKGASNSSPDVLGLQCGLDRTKAALQRKKDEYQAQAQKLQQASARICLLEASTEEKSKVISDLRQQLLVLEIRMKEEQIQINSERLEMSLRLSKQQHKLVNRKEELKEIQAERNSLAVSYNIAQSRIKKLEEKVHDQKKFGDADIADRVRLRNLLDQVQARLATVASLDPDMTYDLPNFSLAWRLALKDKNGIVEDAPRIERAKELLAGKPLEDRDLAFVANEQAFEHICLFGSRFRKGGNDLHQLMDRSYYLASIRRYVERNPGDNTAYAILCAMLDYIFPSSNPLSPA